MPPETIVFDLYHSLALSKYNGRKQLFCKNDGKWSFGDTVLKGSGPLAPLAPLDDFEKYPNGSKPRNVGENSPKTPHRSLFALVLANLRFKKMSRCTVLGRENFAAIGFLEIELVKKGCRTVNLLTGFVKPGGTSLENDLCLCPEFDLKSELRNGRVKALTKKDCLVWRDSRTTKHTSCFYNYSPINTSGIIRIGSLRNPSKIGL